MMMMMMVSYGLSVSQIFTGKVKSNNSNNNNNDNKVQRNQPGWYEPRVEDLILIRWQTRSTHLAARRVVSEKTGCSPLIEGKGQRRNQVSRIGHRGTRAYQG